MTNNRNQQGRLTFAQWRVLTFSPLVPAILLAGPIIFVLGARGLIFSRGIWVLLTLMVLMVCGIIFRRALFYWGIPVHTHNAYVKSTLLGMSFIDSDGRTWKFDRSLLPYRMIPKTGLVTLYYIQDGEKRLLLHVEKIFSNIIEISDKA